jgi:hypothetical protein
MNIPIQGRAKSSDFAADVDSIYNDVMQNAVIEEAALSPKDDSGILLLTVIVDGGYQKESHGHNYNSKCGTAVVIGMSTT